MPGEVGQFFETEGQDIGRTKADSDSAISNAREMATAEDSIRTAQEKADETGTAQLVDVGSREALLEPTATSDRLENEIAWTEKNIADKNIGQEATKEIMGRVLSASENASDDFVKMELDKASRAKQEALNEHLELQRQADKEKIKRLEQQLRDM